GPFDQNCATAIAGDSGIGILNLELFSAARSEQAGQTGTNLLFLLRVLPAPCKNACWETSQTLLKTASARCRLRVPSERFHPRTNKKHAKGRRKIDLWRVSFTGSNPSPVAVSLLRRIVRYFSVPAKAAAFPPWPCGIPGKLPSSA